MTAISAYMLTFNNEDTVERALRSLDFVDEIVVVDSYSCDETLELAKKYTDRVIQRQWAGFRDQYQFASEQCKHDWLLFVDADEEVSEKLAAEMKSTLASNNQLPSEEQIRGYFAHRRTFYLNRWILHGGWIPDYEIRLYHKAHGAWKGDLHAKIQVTGKTAHFGHFYYHYTYKDISAQIQTIDKYSATAAKDMDDAGKRFSYLHLVGNPIVRFIKEYVFKLGFRDGFPGFVVAVNTMFYVFIKHAKLWERQRVSPEDVERAIRNKPE